MQNENHSPRGEGPRIESHRELLARLLRELLQVERATGVLLRRAAERLNGTSPAEPLRETADHVQRSIAEVGELARRHELPVGRVAVLLGSSLAMFRQAVFERLVDHERAYRRALLDLHHGIDLVQLIRRVADASGQVEIGGFCTRWLEERAPLVERATAALSWFAEHPERAAEVPLPRLVVRARRGERMRPRASGESRPQA